MTILNRQELEGSNDILPEYKKREEDIQIIIPENFSKKDIYSLCIQLSENKGK